MHFRISWLVFLFSLTSFPWSLRWCRNVLCYSWFFRVFTKLSYMRWSEKWKLDRGERSYPFCKTNFFITSSITPFSNSFFFNANITLNEVRREGIDFNKTKITPMSLIHLSLTHSHYIVYIIVLVRWHYCVLERTLKTHITILIKVKLN